MTNQAHGSAVATGLPDANLILPRRSAGNSQATTASAKGSVAFSFAATAFRLEAVHAKRRQFSARVQSGWNPSQAEAAENDADYDESWRLRELMDAAPATSVRELAAKARAAELALEDDDDMACTGAGSFVDLTKSIAKDIDRLAKSEGRMVEVQQDSDADLDWRDRLDSVRARARTLELALMSDGMSLDDPTYRDALLQQARDIARGLDRVKDATGRLHSPIRADAA